MDGEVGQYVAHDALGEEYERFWQSALETFLGYGLHKKRIVGRRTPILVM